MAFYALLGLFSMPRPLGVDFLLWIVVPRFDYFLYLNKSGIDLCQKEEIKFNGSVSKKFRVRV
jgi:hypothetical protein